VYSTEGSETDPIELRRLAAELGIAQRVIFLGHVPKPEAALRAVDVIVHASVRPEPFGLVVAEGMACGRVVIAAGAGGAAELIDSGKNGLLHRPGDVRDLEAAIRWVIENRTAWPTLSSAARRTAEARFDRKRMASELIPVYRRLTQKHGVYEDV
jgi:glycosyltransferase involved in cell wall biosynthesis